MQTDLIEIQSPAPGTQLLLQVLRFGTPGTGPKAYIKVRCTPMRCQRFW